jgi:hypothetical protein
MEDEHLISKSEETPKANPLILLFVLIELSGVIKTQIISSIVVLLSTSNDCENPIRTWITITASVLGFHSVFIAFFQRAQGKLAAMSVAVNTVVLSFLFLWMLTGFVWIYFDDECKDDFQKGFYLVLGLFSVYFGSIAAVILFFFGIVAVVCVGSIYINSLLTDENLQ